MVSLLFPFLALAPFAWAAPTLGPSQVQPLIPIINAIFPHGEPLTSQVLQTFLEPIEINLARNSYVYRDGSSLKLNGEVWTASGANVYWLGLDENVIPPAGSPFYAPFNASYPSHGRITEIMNVLMTMGARTIRSQTLGVSVGNPLSVMPALGVYNEQAFDTMHQWVSEFATHGPKTPEHENHDSPQGKQLHQLLNMAPTTRRNLRITPPPGPSEGQEANTVRKTRFYDAWDREHERRSMRAICKDHDITEGTGRLWKKQREELGSLAYRHTRKLSSTFGRRSKVTKSVCKMLVSPSRNPVRNQPYDAQITYHNIPIKRRQLQKKLREHTNGGQIYKAAFVKKEISVKNKDERVLYGKEYKEKTVDNFWRFVFFTDEAHIDPTAQQALGILRERAKRYDDENIIERGERKGVKFHIAAWITWDAKAEKLEFYHDEEEHEEQPPMPPKPRRRPKTESEDEYQARLIDWEAQKPHKVDVKPQGNSMTQKYYTERLLPVYIKAIQEARDREPGPWVLQEDGDPSHGMRKEGLARQLKDLYSIVNFKHPAQSPDLNPIKAIWNIIKQWLRRRIFYSDEEVQEEWSKVTIEEVQKRILDMPGRCLRLTKNGGKPIKTALW